MIGYGRDRGPPTTCKGEDGWKWAAENTKRWGTNQVDSPSMKISRDEALVTWSFATTFDENLPTPHEAQAAHGDSGGAVFVESDSGYELAGVMWAVESEECLAAIHANLTYVADLSVYREQILGITRSVSEEVERRGAKISRPSRGSRGACASSP
jgi:hypothetical protein